MHDGQLLPRQIYPPWQRLFSQFFSCFCRWLCGRQFFPDYRKLLFGCFGHTAFFFYTTYMLKNQIRIADSSRNTLISAVLLCCASAACRIHAVSLSFILCVAWHCTISFSTGACKLSAECARNAPHQYWHTSLGYRSLLDSILSDCSATRENVYIRML